MPVFKKLLWVFTLVTVCAVFIAHQYSSLAAKKILVSKLEEVGLFVENIKSLKVGIFGSKITGLRLKKIAPADSLKIDIENIVLEYNLLAAIKGQLENIFISNVYIEIKQLQEAPQNNDSTTLPIFSEALENYAQTVKIKNVSISFEPEFLTKFELHNFADNLLINFDLDIRNEKLQLAGVAALEKNELLKIIFNAQYGIRKQFGNVTLASDKTSSAYIVNLINSHLQRNGVSLNITAGEINFSAKAKVKKQTIGELDLDVSLHNVSGLFNEALFEKLTLNNSLSLAKDSDLLLLTKKSQPCSLEHLLFGVALHKIKGTCSLTISKNKHFEFSATNLAGQIFEGKISTKNFLYSSSLEKNELDLQLSALNLNEIMNLFPQKQIKATGTLDGELPITYNQNQILINNGILKARSPGGEIIYSGADNLLQPNNKNMELVSKALSNYSYQDLSAQVDLDKNGQLLISLATAGTSPALKQAVNLNLRLEQNLPALLKSLQMTANINRDLTTNIRE